MLEVIKSKQFIATLVGLIINLVVAAVPALEPVQGEMITSVTLIFTILIGGLFYADAKEVDATARMNIANAESSARVQEALTGRKFVEGQLQAMQTPSGQMAIEAQSAPVPYAGSRSPQFDALLILDEVLADEKVTDFATLRAALKEHITQRARYM